MTQFRLLISSCTIAVLVVAAACVNPNTISAQSNGTATSSVSQSTDPARLLHFWVGQWDCYLPKGGPINGRNDLTARVGDNVIHEKWMPAGGGPGGESWNYFDRNTKTWRQHWIDPQGRPFVFVGRPHENGLLFEGPHLDGKPNRYRRRMFIRAIEGGRVRQTGTQSSDGGKSWRPNFDLIYVPRGVPFRAGSTETKTRASKQFDFLIGDWTMEVQQFDADGKMIRTLTEWSRVRPALGGAVLIDEWNGSGFTIRSWDPKNKVWRLFWTDRNRSAGKMQIWEGTFNDGVGTFTGGKSMPANSRQSISKIEFSEIQKDSLTWKMWKSTDNGKTWVLDYVRKYKRTGEP